MVRRKNYISDSGKHESTACNKSANKNRKKKHQRKIETDDSLVQFRGKNQKIPTGRVFSPLHHES